MLRFAAVLLALQLPLVALAGESPEVFRLNEKGEKEWGYAQAVRIGDTIHVSGTTGGGATMDEQVRNAYERIRRTLEHYGAEFTDIVKETVFTTDLEAMKRARDVRRAFYGDHTPASSWIGIDRLFVPELMVEIEVIAVLGTPARN